MSFVVEAEKKLKDAGLRFTEQRKRVLAVLGRNKKPLNPYEIAEKVGKGVDVATVYRFLKVLENVGLAHFVKDARGYIACEEVECACEQEHCHHQFICRKCRKVTELHCDDDGLMRAVVKENPQLTIEDHYFEFSGVCGKCR